MDAFEIVNTLGHDTIRRRRNSDDEPAVALEGGYNLAQFSTARSVSAMFAHKTLVTFVELPDTVEYLPCLAFSRCVHLQAVIARGVTAISDRVFSFCPKLTRVDAPLVTHIGIAAFERCSMLSAVSFPAVKVILTFAFYYCTRLHRVAFPHATSVGNRAFDSCTALCSAYLPKLGGLALGLFTNAAQLRSFAVGRWCSHVYNDCFSGCHALATVTFWTAPVHLSPYAFHGSDNTSRLVYIVSPTRATWSLEALEKVSRIAAARKCMYAYSCDAPLRSFFGGQRGAGAYPPDIADLIFTAALCAKRLHLPHLPPELWTLISLFLF
jgi:hypothetical protein